jgi:AmmeMemoRadiSam system protein B/AmmeMemoRadiSam system protein A
MGIVRQAAVAGSFYPSDPETLATDVRRMLSAVPVFSGAAPKALIAPHAGYIYSGPIAASAYARLAPVRQDISRVVLIGPAHKVAFAGVAVSTASAFQTPLGPVPVDMEAVNRVKAIPGVVVLDQAHGPEHSLEVHLPFLQMTLDRFSLVPLVVGQAPDFLVAQVLETVWGGAETLIVVSSDLSHYEDYESARAHDRATAQAIEHCDPDAFDGYGACGRMALGGLLLLAKQKNMRVVPLDMRNSGDTAGSRDRVVGYGAWAVYEGRQASIPELLLELARKAIGSQFESAPEALSVPNLPELTAQGASFVTLRKSGELRGCIGSAQAWRGLAEDVADNARRAAFADPRFPPLSAVEWSQVRLSLSLLSPPEPMEISSREDLLAKLRPHADGLIIEAEERRALFLPAVWQQLPEPEDFLGHLLKKAGLGPDYWSEGLRAWRFGAEEFEEG